jgi:hypothetical protein
MKSCKVPLKLTVCVLPGVLRLLSVMVKAPLRVGGVGGSITDWGVKVTLMVQELPAATLTLQLLVWPKSPITLMLVTVSAALPVLLRVTGCAALVVPTNWLPKVRLPGETSATGPVATPLPVKLKL